jgi:hypothetical protein
MVAAGLTSPFVGPSLVGFTVTPDADDLRHLAGLVETGNLTRSSTGRTRWPRCPGPSATWRPGGPGARW